MPDFQGQVGISKENAAPVFVDLVLQTRNLAKYVITLSLILRIVRIIGICHVVAYY